VSRINSDSNSAELSRLPRIIVFAPIAMREVRFYLETAKCITNNNENIHIAFISYYQPGNEIIKKSNYRCYDLYEYLKTDGEWRASEMKKHPDRYYGIENIHKLILHEKLTFGIWESRRLHVKFMRYLDACEAIIGELLAKYSANDMVVMQELGGFIAPLSLYFICKRHGVDHVFFEPSYYRGRLLFIRNSLDPLVLQVSEESEILPDVVQYIESSISSKTVVIPPKDRHHFMDMKAKKIINRDNVKKLLLKLKYKYFDGRKEEYSYIYNHVIRYLKMYVNRKKNEQLYIKYDTDCMTKCYIYYPFHVQLDYSLSVRSPEYLNQLALVEYLCQLLPPDIMLFTKEHPASIGGFEHDALKKILERNDNLRLLHPLENSYDIIKHAVAIVTVNSKVGAEALAMGKEVIVVGKAFYSESGIVHYISQIKSFECVIRDIISGKKKNHEAERLKFFNCIWNNSYPVELYSMEAENVCTFASEILSYLSVRDSKLD